MSDASCVRLERENLRYLGQQRFQLRWWSLLKLKTAKAHDSASTTGVVGVPDRPGEIRPLPAKIAASDAPLCRGDRNNPVLTRLWPSSTLVQILQIKGR
jgi:hypothetical protein